MRKLQPYVPMAVLIVCCLAYLYWLLGEVVLHPNAFIIMNNTDGRQILFNTYFYTRFGSGLTLSNQLFPNFDVLFMTDAQASVSVLLNALQTIGIPVLPYVVGITNGLILYSIPLAALMLFASARLLGIRSWMSVWGAFFITALSPQWLRVVCGHAGLAYLIYIPALIYAVLYWASPKKKSGLVFLLTLFLVLFIGFNNGYILLSGIAFLSLFSVVHMVQTRQWRSKAVWYPLILVCIAGLGLGIIKKLSDPVHDRETAPYGFLVYHATPETVLLPSHGVVLETLNKLLPIPVEIGQEEGAAYVGLFTLLILLATAVYLLVQLVRTFRFRFSRNKALNSLLWTSLILLLYAMAFPFRFGYESLLDYFPFIKQFRSPGRFAWMFYYVVSLYALFRFELWRRSKHRTTPFFIVALLLFSLCYIIDIHDLQTWNMRYIKAGGYTKNYFNEGEKHQAVLTAHGIDTSHVAAILGLPLNCAWNSKFERGDEGYDITQRMVELSCASGIPWLTAKLSRASTFNTLRSGQWVANPIIEREALAEWPSQKDLLLVHQKTYSPTKGEWFMMQQGTCIYSDSLFAYYQIPINNRMHQNRDSIRQHIDALLNAQANNLKQALQNKEVQYGATNEVIVSSLKEEKTLLRTQINQQANDTIVEFSVWTQIRHLQENMPTLKLTVFDSLGNTLSTNRINMHSATDYQYGYLRYVYQFPVTLKTQTVEVLIEKGNDFTFTRWLIRPSKQTVILNQNGLKTYNAYLLERTIAAGR